MRIQNVSAILAMLKDVQRPKVNSAGPQLQAFVIDEVQTRVQLILNITPKRHCVLDCPQYWAFANCMQFPGCASSSDPY